MEFYTIMTGDRFLNSNLFDKYNNIISAVKFIHKEDAEKYLNELRKDKGFRLVKVKYELKEME